MPELPFLLNDFIIFLSCSAVGLFYSLIDNVLRIIFYNSLFFIGNSWAVCLFIRSLKYQSGSSNYQNGIFPVNISWRITPNDHISLFSLYIF